MCSLISIVTKATVAAETIFCNIKNSFSEVSTSFCHLKRLHPVVVHKAVFWIGIKLARLLHSSLPFKHIHKCL